MDLEVARADRRLEPVAVAARLLEGLRDRATRRRRRSAACGAAAACRGRARAERRRSRARPARAAAARAAGPAGRSRASRSRRRRGPARCRRGRATSRPPASSPACARPSAKSAYGRLMPLRDHPRDAFDLLLEPGVDTQLAPGDLARRPRPCGRRGSARDRRSTATRSASASAVADRGLELGRVVADDLDPRRLDAEREQRAREEGAVQVGALAAHELAARDDDDRARACAASGVNSRRRRRSSSPSRRRPAP